MLNFSVPGYDRVSVQTAKLYDENHPLQKPVTESIEVDGRVINVEVFARLWAVKGESAQEFVITKDGDIIVQDALLRDDETGTTMWDTSNPRLIRTGEFPDKSQIVQALVPDHNYYGLHKRYPAETKEWRDITGAIS